MLLAHDLGTTGNKASLHDDDGRLLAALTVHYETRYAPGGTVEQDPDDWWRAVCSASRELLQREGVDPQNVHAVSFSGQMMGAVLLDAYGSPVRPALIWADHRSGEQCRSLISAVGLERAYTITGHQLNPTYSLTKVMWVRDHEPDVFARVASVCQAKDLMVYRLTGVLVTDPSDASSTNAYDQVARVWSTELFDAAGIDRGLFPDIVPSTTVVGKVTAEAAGSTGLAAGTPVVLGGGDGPMAAVGAGVIGPEDGAYTYLGSSSWVSVAAHAPLHDPPMRTMTFDHVVPGRFVPTATMQSGAGSLAWLADLLAPGGDADRFDRLVTAADTATAAEEGLYFLPHLLGERSPYWNANARGAFVGLCRHHGPEHLTKAVLEGVAFNLATCVEAFRSSGVDIDSVDAIGGGAASDVWLQILADVWGCSVHRRTIVEEANSLGAAIVGGVGVGTVDDFSAARQLSEVTATFDPDADRHARYREGHAVFLDAYQRLEPWFNPVGDT